MTSLGTLISALALTLGTQPAETGDAVFREPERRYAVVERPGMAPVIVKGSEQVLARNDLVGSWQVVHLETGGTARPDLASTLSMRFSRGKLELMQLGRETITVAYDLDIDHYPRFFNWHDRISGLVRQQKGLYWIEDDTLMLCMGSVHERRPSEFVTAPGDGRILFVLKRFEKPADVKIFPNP